MKKNRICIISFSDLKNDPRVRRQINSLKDKYKIVTLGLKKSGINGINEFELPSKRSFLSKIRSRIAFLIAGISKELYYEYIESKYPVNSIFKILPEEKFDLAIANGLNALIIANRIAYKYNIKILFDAHEYEPMRIEDQLFYRLFINRYKDFLCQKYLSLTIYITTVSSGIANVFNKNYCVNPKVILNVPKYKKINLKKVNPNYINLIHHGIAHQSRNLEDLIKLIPLLEERFHLTLILVKRNIDYFNYLKELSDRICPGRIVFRNPVTSNEIIPAISEYDIELIIYRPLSLNIKYSLPNKFFESIMAGLALVTGPSPEMKNILEKYNCGFVSNSFDISEIASLINKLSLDEIMKKKRASLEAAKTLNAEIEMNKFLKIIEGILPDKI
jgi:glycosyltransferase involved in cell wall biosynthesis